MQKNVFVLAAILGLMASIVSAEDAAPAQAAPAATLSAEVKIGTGLENRDVTGEAATFPAGTTQLVGWSRITGASEPTQVMHVWKLNGEQIASVPLAIKFSPFRTNSRITVEGKPGKWSLEVQDMNGNVLASKDADVSAN